MDEHERATEALEKIGKMADDIEESYEKKIELLEFQVEDAYNIAEQAFQEKHNLQTELHEVRGWKKVHYAVYFFLFVYGLVYGAYFCRKREEL